MKSAEEVGKLRIGRTLFRTTRYDWGRGKRNKGKGLVRTASPALSEASSGFAESCRLCTGVERIWDVWSGEWQGIGYLGPTLICVFSCPTCFVV